MSVDMTKVDNWLAGIPSKSTRKRYINGVKTFEAFYNEGIETRALYISMVRLDV